MIVLWVFLGLSLLLPIGAAMFVVGYRHDFVHDGSGGVFLGIPGAMLAVVGLIFVIITSCMAISRLLSHSVCDKKAEISGKPYLWVDYNFANYDCVLHTPSGNITETPVLPIENVTEQPD